MTRLKIIIFYSLATVIFLPRCKHLAGPEERHYGDSLTIVTYHEPVAINPLTVVSGISAMLSDAIFDGLVRLDKRLEARPHLASSYEKSKDNLKWTFHIRRGVKFHDGIECTAEDVKFTIEQILKYSQRNPYAGGLANIRSVYLRDRYTVEITLKRPSMFFIYSMDFGILPAHIFKGRGEKDLDLGYHPVGTGPFKFSQWNKDEIILDANRGYFLGRPYLDRIVVKVYPNQQLAWVKIMQGEGDFLYPVDPSLYRFLKQVKSLNVYTNHGLYYSIIAFNNENKLFNEHKVKVALNYAIDKEYIISKILGGKGESSSGIIWPGSWAHNPSIKPYPYDPQKAQSLLKEAGWIDRDGDNILDKDGYKFSFTLLIKDGDETNNLTAMHIQQQLWELGISVNIKTIPVTAIDKLLQGKYDAVLIDIFSHIYPDYNYTIWHSLQVNKRNICRYRSIVIDRLLDEGRLSKDMKSARNIYYRFQQEMYDNPPGIFLYWTDYFIAVHKRFRGVQFTPVGMLSYLNEWYVPEGEQKYKRRVAQ